jgi:hypothetical protein
LTCGYQDLRDWAIIDLMAETMTRAAELLDLERDDVNISPTAARTPRSAAALCAPARRSSFTAHAAPLPSARRIEDIPHTAPEHRDPGTTRSWPDPRKVQAGRSMTGGGHSGDQETTEVRAARPKRSQEQLWQALSMASSDNTQEASIQVHDGSATAEIIDRLIRIWAQENPAGEPEYRKRLALRHTACDGFRCFPITSIYLPMNPQMLMGLRHARDAGAVEGEE